MILRLCITRGIIICIIIMLRMVMHTKDTATFILCKRSTDLVNWEWVAGPFLWCANLGWLTRQRHSIAHGARGHSRRWHTIRLLRRQDRVNVGGQEILRMYYSIVIDNYIKTGKSNTQTNFDGSWTERAFIGMWVDRSCRCRLDRQGIRDHLLSSDRGLNYNRSSLSDWMPIFTTTPLILPIS